MTTKTIKEKVMMVDMAVSIFAILLLGVFLGQAVSVSFAYYLIPIGTTMSFIAAEVFVIQATGVTVGYLIFQLILKKAFGPDVLVRDVKQEIKTYAYDANGPIKRHELKTVNPWFQAVWDGGKKFEIRLNDRGFRKGDLLILKEHDPSTNKFSGREVLCHVDYLLPENTFGGLEPEYCAMSMTILERNG